MSDVATGSVPSDNGPVGNQAAGSAEPDTPPSAPLLNPANLLTALRLMLVPVFVVVLILSEGDSTPWRLAAATLFLLASITDFYDGKIARSRNIVTRFGAVADPIADKALTGAALVGLSAFALLPWWVTGVIIARELGVTALRFWVIRHGVIAASRGGKLKTLLQIIAIIGYLLPLPGPLHLVAAVVMAAAVLVTVVTGGDYVLRAIALRRGAKR